MRIHRRGFLRWVAGGAAWLLARPRAWAAVPPETALGIHRATRNTRLGAIGTLLRARRGALLPEKPYRGKARVGLPAPSWYDERGLFAAARAYPPDASFADAPCSHAALSALLALTNGVTKRGSGFPLRAAPSAGALYAGEVYVVADRVEGVAPGAYYYSVIEHALVPIDADVRVADVASALERPGEAAGCAAAMLLTNVFARYRVRYANRGYRYALIDSGHIGENLRLAAGELGLAARAPLRWQDDRLNALLAVDGLEEAVCAVHLVGMPGPTKTKDAAGARELAERQAADPSSLSGDLDEPERYHQATKLVEGKGGMTAHETATARGAGPAPPGDEGGPDTAVHTAIRHRRSASTFEETPLPRAALLRVLYLARGLPALHRTDFIDLYAVANRVEGLAPGLYRYDSATGRLEEKRTGSLAQPLVDADLGQARSGQAAVALIAVARLADASARNGARSYRDLLLDAGATAQRIYLGAEAGGLAARNLAAYYDDELDHLLGLDGEREVAVHLTALGPGD